MNRSNVGNVVTNGMQVLSVAATTGAGWHNQIKKQKLADASSGLNNLSEEEVKQVGQMRADQLREDLRLHQNKTEGMVHLSDSEQQQFGEKKAEDLRKYINGSEQENENTSVDDLMSGSSSLKSPQAQELRKKIVGDIEYTLQWVGRNKNTKRYAGNLNVEEGEIK